MVTAQEEDLQILVEVMQHEMMMVMLICSRARAGGQRAAHQLARDGEVEFDDLMEYSPLGIYDQALSNAFRRLFRLGLVAAERTDELTSRTSEARGLSRDS